MYFQAIKESLKLTKGVFIMSIGLLTTTTLAILFATGVFQCNGGKNVRVDEVKNKALENLCSGDMVLKVFEKSPDIAREFHCQCQQAAKKSDQNNCETIINHNNSKSRVSFCETAKNPDECQRVFQLRK